MAGAARKHRRSIKRVCEAANLGKERANATIAFLGYVLSMPPCKMAQKSHGCPECQCGSCMGLAERNVRLYLSGTIPEQRLE